ncbi:DNA replication licensing factor MCM6-like, partial [Trifolium medium]|nr:DNA replication licensing factor MCM6-like [Trifolium medium]
AGCLPRSLDVILRHENVEHARAGDMVIFTGTIVVIPDILPLASPGKRSECRREASQRKGSTSGNEGVTGLKALRIYNGRKETDIRNRKMDSDEDDRQFTVNLLE